MADSLLNKKRVLLEKLKKLTILQVQMLDNGQYEPISSLFDEKDRIIEEIDRIDLKLSEPARKNDEILVLLDELRQLNAQLVAGLDRTKKSIATKLIELQRNKKGDSLYHQRSIQVEGAFIDKKK
ncbi:hypothetical protein [Zhaonella formicivorans]|uniref:hypothetical protein n=1 Tax=Zhaonella formicivorans TaxID=2528593 RepID=UPI0010DCD24E|nr:hypothetical protein [Zhaonella formicivorans]